MNRLTKNLILYAFLLPVLLIVQLPLIWMLLTAVKAPGFGLVMQFWPKPGQTMYTPTPIAPGFAPP